MFGVRDDRTGDARDEMVATLRGRYGIRDERILEAMGGIPRHRFVPEGDASPPSSYSDQPLAIGHGQTISQPFIVAYMTECLQIGSGCRVLEIGTGSGYQTAVLAELGATVYSVEVVPELARRAEELLRSFGYGDVHIRVGDGYAGWPEFAPYDAIIGTCAPASVPPELVDQLADDGRMMLPVGEHEQRLVLISKHGGRAHETEDIGVRFVPMVRGQCSLSAREIRDA